MAWVLAAACCGAAAVRPRFVGIDLGTTNSAVALLDGTEPRLVSLPDGASTTPPLLSYRCGVRALSIRADHLSANLPHHESGPSFGHGSHGCDMSSRVSN